MRNVFIKVLALGLAALFVLSTLSGCSWRRKDDVEDSNKESNNETSTDGPNKVVGSNYPSGNQQVVPSEIAALFGVDPGEKDSDKDGLSNYVEIYITGTSPTVADTDGDGVLDVDEDADEDGLSNKVELNLGTDLAKKDTDNDGLDDYTEVYEWYTNPCKGDTDGDGVSDGDEVTLGLHPLRKKTDGVTLDSQRTFTQELRSENIDEQLLSKENGAIPSLSLTASGNINSSVSVTVSDSSDFSDSRAIVGEPIDIYCENMESGTISFALQKESTYSFMGTTDAGTIKNTKLICKYREDGTTEYLMTRFDEVTHTISADIESEGTYFVLDVRTLFNELGLDFPELETSANAMSASVSTSSSSAMAQADIVFLIDTTGSMGDEINNVKNNIVSFIDVLKEKGVSAGLALIDYQDLEVDGMDSTRVHKNGSSNWFYNLDQYKASISALQLGDGGDWPESAVDALETARRLDMRPSAGKIFVLVTDADYKNDNRYGVSSMAEEIQLLKNLGITCAVVSSSSCKSDYYDLYTETNGIWADINGDFKSELMRLADKIGTDIVAGGYWIYLEGPVPIPVRLDEEPVAGSTVDTDKDGIPDVDELLGVDPSVNLELESVLARLGSRPVETTFGTIQMYRYKSNPAAVDTDFDGIDDKEDTSKRNNSFKGQTTRLKDNELKATGNISFCVDYRNFFSGNTTYKKDISVLSSLFAGDIYEGAGGVYIEVTEGATLTGNHTPEALAELFGMSDVQVLPIGNDNDKTDILLGHRVVDFGGSKKEILLVVVRGTDSSFAEWSSNFDVGADTAAYYSMIGKTRQEMASEWTDRANHKGFDVTATRVAEKVKTYISSYLDPTLERVFWITGHSRGAAIANVLGARYEDAGETTFVYTFASPGTTTKDETVTSQYRSIFNVINSDDLIPCLPLSEGWGFRRYGQDRSISVGDKYEDSTPRYDRPGTFEALLNDDYNNVAKWRLNFLLDEFGKVAANREELYVYTYDENTVQNWGKGCSESEAQQKVESVKAAMDPAMQQFCEFEILSIDGKIHVQCYQTPAYFMQVLALIASKASNKAEAAQAVYKNSVAGKYEWVRTEFVVIGMGGIEHPHWTETYYLIASNNFQ